MLVTRQDIAAARSADPRIFLRSQGYEVVKEGMNGWIAAKGGVKAYRLSFKGEQGIWLYCDISGYPGGDIIQLAMAETGSGFQATVLHLRDTCFSEGPMGCDASRKPAGGAPDRAGLVLSLPPSAGVDVAVRYLGSRGIPSDIVQSAYRQGFLQTVPDGVLFLGKNDQGKVCSASWRSVFQGACPSKRDLAGSEKRFVPVLSGSPSEVWIVEGGVDALAAHALARLDGKEAPTAIVSGGAFSSRFLMPGFRTCRVESVLARSSKVIVAMEREKNSEVQSRTDKSHVRQANLAGMLAEDAIVLLWAPLPGRGKDVADSLAFRLGILP